MEGKRGANLCPVYSNIIALYLVLLVQSAKILAGFILEGWLWGHTISAKEPYVAVWPFGDTPQNLNQSTGVRVRACGCGCGYVVTLANPRAQVPPDRALHACMQHPL